MSRTPSSAVVATLGVLFADRAFAQDVVTPSPAITATTWLGVQLEAMPSGAVEVTTNNATATASTQLGYGIDGYLERRVGGSNFSIALAPRLITPVQMRGVDGRGDELDLRGEIALGGAVMPTFELHALGSVGYSWLFHALANTDPTTGATSYATAHSLIAGFGARASYALNPRLRLVSELSYQWGLPVDDHVTTSSPVDLRLTDRFLTIGVGVATALD